MRNFLVTLIRNPLSLLGSAVTTASAVLILGLFGLGLLGFEGGPYAGILAFLILPAVFVAGLALIPVGWWRERRRALQGARTGESRSSFPVLDLNRDRTRKMVLIFVAATTVNVVILALSSYKGVEVMESTTFCGTTCHSVMSPEYTTYQRSPHANVKCVSCHIGPGANWFVKSKLSGSWQVIAVAFHLYPRPIPTPVRNLRPARETCEQCHWPAKFVGDRLKVMTHYDVDEKNTEKKSVLLLRVGGVQGRVAQGIHWHVDPGIKLRYRADPTRQTVHEVELTKSDGTVKKFLAVDSKESAGDSEWRVMDCIDCHNRPSHIYRLAGNEIDAAMQQGKIDRTLPFIKREGLRVLEQEYASHDEARTRIPEQIRSFYEQNYKEQLGAKSASVETAGSALAAIYCQNVFPGMKVRWGAYPNDLGHQDFPGCFRCHDDAHKTADGEAISQDCSTCHTLLAMEEENPQILSQLNP